MTYPKNFAFIEKSSNRVVEIKTAWGPETTFNPAPGYIMFEIPYDSQVNVGWVLTFDENTNQPVFSAP